MDVRKRNDLPLRKDGCVYIVRVYIRELNLQLGNEGMQSRFQYFIAGAVICAGAISGLPLDGGAGGFAIEQAHAFGITLNLPGVGHTRSYRKRRRRSGGDGASSSCASTRWSTMQLGQKQIATNNQGVMVTYDNEGNIIVNLQMKAPLPSIPENRKVPVTLSFGRYGTQNLIGVIGNSSNMIEISGFAAQSVTDLMKKAGSIKITFINNDYCTRLRGSGAAIDRVQAAANFWKMNKKDAIDERREERAKAEHAKRTETMAKTQQESADKLNGIRPKGNLKKDQARNKPSVNIQYFVPGSEATGQMWVDWDVDETKGPVLRLNFIDIKRKIDVKAEVIALSLEPVTENCRKDISKPMSPDASPACKLVRGLLVAEAWGKKAQQKGLRRQFSKTVLYAEGGKNSKISASVNFILYENGAVAAQIEKRTHGFPRRFNFTMANALELARYVEDIRVDAAKNIKAGSMTDADLDNIFKVPN